MIIVVNTINSKPIKPTKRATPSIFQKKKKRIRGYVDRISNGIVVIVVRDPEDNESLKEVLVPINKFPNKIPEEGDYVSVTIEV